MSDYRAIEQQYEPLYKRYPHVCSPSICNFAKAYRWCEENFELEDFTERWYNDLGSFRFLDQKDAALFMMFWGGSGE